MSLVVFPFKEEDVDVVVANVATAAGHHRIDEVWAVAASEGSTMAAVDRASTDIATAGIPIQVFAQDRVGEYRAGKGDGMNTAIRRAAKRGFDRVHFYDADITNFDEAWIDGAEDAADRGYGVVRHRFPRAATDAMITWMVTRPGLALLFGGTLLPRLGQPLGGELLLSGSVVERLADDSFVAARSDWGVDTVLTHATSTMDTGIYEHNIASGKRHALYGSLTELRDMALECLDAVGSLSGRARPGRSFQADPPAEVPEDLKQTVAYDLDATRSAIAHAPNADEREILETLGTDPSAPIHMDKARWQEVFPLLLDGFQIDDPAWRSAAFRLWVERVIHYTANQVPQGYDAAIDHLERAVLDFENWQ